MNTKILEKYIGFERFTAEQRCDNNRKRYEMVFVKLVTDVGGVWTVETAFPARGLYI